MDHFELVSEYAPTGDPVSYTHLVLPQRLWRAYGYAYSAGKANEQQ